MRILDREEIAGQEIAGQEIAATVHHTKDAAHIWWLVAIPVLVIMIMVTYRHFKDTSNIDGDRTTIVSTLAEAESADAANPGIRLSSPSSKTNTPAILVAKIAWVRTVILYMLAIVLSFFVIVFQSSCLLGARRRDGLWIALGCSAILVSILLALQQGEFFRNNPNPLTIMALNSLASEGLDKLGLGLNAGWLPFNATALPGLCLGVMLLVLAILSISRASKEDSKLDDIRLILNGTRMATYTVAAVLATAVMHVNAVHLLPVALMPNGTDAERALIEGIKQMATAYSMAQGTIWTLFLVAIYVPMAVAIGEVADKRARKELESSGIDPADRRTIEDWIKTHRPGSRISDPAVLTAVELTDLQSKIPEVALSKQVVLVPGGASVVMIGFPAAVKVDYKSRHEWLASHGLERSISQQLTTIAVVLAPFVSGSAFMELLGTLG